MIRVLVAEDSPTARALLVTLLVSSSDLEVVGEAKNGLEAVEMAKLLKPDIVTMDIQMPLLDGFEATKRIMTECPMPIVIISSLDVNSVQFSMEAMRAGALAVLPKPVGPGAPDFERSARYLVAMVRSMSAVRIVRRWPESPPYRAPQAASLTDPRPSGGDVRLVAMAASTGGPAALHKILGALEPDFPVPIIMVQHIAMGFAAGFATWLDGSVRLRVKVAEAGEPLRGGTAYLAPDDLHMGVSERFTVLLSAAPHVGSFRPSGSFLFESAAKAAASQLLAMIMTGMGNDGVAGLRVVRAAGGRVVAQDEATSEIFGMPGVAIAEGLADYVLPLSEFAPYLARVTAPAARGRS